MPTSGDLESGDSLYSLSPGISRDPPRQIDPAPSGNDLGRYINS